MAALALSFCNLVQNTKETCSLIKMQEFKSNSKLHTSRNLAKLRKALELQMDASRISIRPFRLSDADDFLTWASDDKVTQYLRWNTMNAREEALKYIQEVAIPHPWRQSICLDDRSIGYISIKPESGNDKHRAHVGYAISTVYWGKGIATTALKIAISSVFKEFPCLVRIEALVEEENKGSQRVLEKVGFTREGFLRKYGFNKGEIRDMLIYSFLSTDKVA